MPGSAYYKIAVQVSDWLSVVEECKINSSTKETVDTLDEVHMDNDEEIISFDVKSLYQPSRLSMNVQNFCILEDTKTTCVQIYLQGALDSLQLQRDHFGN